MGALPSALDPLPVHILGKGGLHRSDEKTIRRVGCREWSFIQQTVLDQALARFRAHGGECNGQSCVQGAYSPVWGQTVVRYLSDSV